MEITNDPIVLISEALKDLGFNDSAVQNIISGAIIISLLSLLALMFYMLYREPGVLERWKYPNLIVLFVVTVSGFLSFSVAILFLLVLTLLTFLWVKFETDQFGLFFNFPMLVFFTALYMLLALSRVKRPADKVLYTSMVPQGFRIFVPTTIKIIVVMFLLIPTILGLHYSLNTGLNVSAFFGSNCECSREDWVDWITFLNSAFMTVIISIYLFYRKQLREFIQRNKHKMPKWVKKLSEKGK